MPALRHPTARAALVVAHPGHELRVHGWLEQVQPQVFVLTDGSGRTGASRLGATAELLARVGAAPGGIFGRLTDHALYDGLLRRDVARFVTLAEELAHALIDTRVDVVVGDRADGHHPGHDLCRLLVDAAVARARAATRTAIANLEFPLFSSPDDGPMDPEVVRLDLDPGAFARKLAAAQAYHELKSEVDVAIGWMGPEPFRVEWLFPAQPVRMDGERPFYERYGEHQVAAGHYTHLIRRHEHMAPIAAALAVGVARGC